MENEEKKEEEILNEKEEILDFTDSVKDNTPSESPTIQSVEEVEVESEAIKTDNVSEPVVETAVVQEESVEPVKDDLVDAVKEEAPSYDNFTSSSETPEKKKKNIVVPIIIVLILLCALGVGAVFLLKNKETGKYNPEDVLGTYIFPVGGHIEQRIQDGAKIKTGTTLIKIPRAMGGAGDITGGLPRVTELFEARNPSNPAVVSEIDGEVTMGRVKRGNREIIVTSKTGEQRKYLVSLSKQILVQEHDAVRAGTPLSDGIITPADILAIKGPTAVQEYIVNEVQDVYRLQGVKINDKHFEIIVRQMMRKVMINDPGDTTFLEQEIVDKLDFADENDRIWGKKVVIDAGDSENCYKGQIISARKLRDENSSLRRRDLRAALQTKSFMSAASFQETTKVLNEAAIRGKVDRLEGMKENVICGHLIPAGTGLRQWEKLIVSSKEEYERLQANKKNVLDFAEKEIVEE